METVRYQVKWYSQLSSLSVTHSQGGRGNGWSHILYIVYASSVSPPSLSLPPSPFLSLSLSLPLSPSLSLSLSLFLSLSLPPSLSPSILLSLPLVTAPLLERRRYNTLEKLLHSSQRDEALLIQMMTLSSSLHTNHHQLNCLLQDMLDQLRSGMSNRQLEIETLPRDSARLDLISHDRSVTWLIGHMIKLYYCSLYSSVPAAKYLLLLSNQKERQQWEHTLRNAQLSSGPLGGSRLQQMEEYDYPLHPSNGGPGRVNRQSSFKTPTPKLLSHLSLPSCRVGSHVCTRATPTIHVPYATPTTH